MNRRALVTMIIAMLPIVIFAQESYIQVVADPGISVFIDGVLKGVTSSEYGGLIIENIPPGVRTVKVVKKGFNLQEENISIKPGEVFTYNVRPFILKLKISETGNYDQQKMELKVGDLVIQSLPVSIAIKIPSLGVNYSKKKDEWKAEEIPEGRYSATFTFMEKSIRDTIVIKYQETTHLLVNMMKMRVEKLDSEPKLIPPNQVLPAHREEISRSISKLLLLNNLVAGFSNQKMDGNIQLGGDSLIIITPENESIVEYIESILDGNTLSIVSKNKIKNKIEINVKLLSFLPEIPINKFTNIDALRLLDNLASPFADYLQEIIIDLSKGINDNPSQYDFLGTPAEIGHILSSWAEYRNNFVLETATINIENSETSFSAELTFIDRPNMNVNKN